MKQTEIDSRRLAAWLDSALPGPAAPIGVTQIKGGASNIIYRVTRADKIYALRRPPVVKNDPTSNNMRRELVLLKALGQTEILHPRLVAAGEDEGVIGVPFALMQWVDGFSPQAPFPDGFSSIESKRALAEQLIDGLATVSTADWRGAGLAEFGKPENFLERQVDRWLGQLERARTRELAQLDDISNWLRANTPAMQRVALIHGDYQFINTMYSPGLPPKLAAIVDWESATIGDPLLDLGWVLAGWRDAGEDETHASYVAWDGFPQRKEMALRYAEKTGLDVKKLDFYMVLALFKLAVIMEGWYARYLAGQSTHPSHQAMETVVPQMLARAAGFAQIA